MQSIESISVLGIGQMGAAAAVCLSRAGFAVQLWARDARKLDSVPGKLAAMVAFLDEHFGPPAGPTREVALTDRLDDVQRDADFVLECVAEDMDQKVDLMTKLRPLAERGAIIASCTSGLSITEMGDRSGLATRLVGAHFWNPPHLMPLVEVVSTDKLDAGIVETTCSLLRAAGKVPVVCKDVLGFIGNRLQHAMWREALSLVQRGICTAEDVDLVARLTFALRLPALGPCANADLVGIPLVSQIQSYLMQDLDRTAGTMPIIQEHLDQGRLGMRTGQGLLDWSNRDPDAMVALRDRQIVRQLKFLAENGALADD